MDHYRQIVNLAMELFCLITFKLTKLVSPYVRVGIIVLEIYAIR